MIVIGRFKETHNNDEYPSIFTVIHDEPPKNKEKILRYLKNGKFGAMSPGYFYDKVDNETILRNPVCYNDGVYAWRSDLIHYYEKYKIDLPEDFIRHVLCKG